MLAPRSTRPRPISLVRERLGQLVSFHKRGTPTPGSLHSCRIPTGKSWGGVAAPAASTGTLVVSCAGAEAGGTTSTHYRNPIFWHSHSVWLPLVQTSNSRPLMPFPGVSLHRLAHKGCLCTKRSARSRPRDYIPLGAITSSGCEGVSLYTADVQVLNRSLYKESWTRGSGNWDGNGTAVEDREETWRADRLRWVRATLKEVLQDKGLDGLRPLAPRSASVVSLSSSPSRWRPQR